MSEKLTEKAVLMVAREKVAKAAERQKEKLAESIQQLEMFDRMLAGK